MGLIQIRMIFYLLAPRWLNKVLKQNMIICVLKLVLLRVQLLDLKLITTVEAENDESLTELCNLAYLPGWAVPKLPRNPDRKAAEEWVKRTTSTAIVYNYLYMRNKCHRKPFVSRYFHKLRYVIMYNYFTPDDFI